MVLLQRLNCCTKMSGLQLRIALRSKEITQLPLPVSSQTAGQCAAAAAGTAMRGSAAAHDAIPPLIDSSPIEGPEPSGRRVAYFNSDRSMIGAAVTDKAE